MKKNFWKNVWISFCCTWNGLLDTWMPWRLWGINDELKIRIYNLQDAVRQQGEVNSKLVDEKNSLQHSIEDQIHQIRSLKKRICVLEKEAAEHQKTFLKNHDQVFSQAWHLVSKMRSHLQMLNSDIDSFDTVFSENPDQTGRNAIEDMFVAEEVADGPPPPIVRDMITETKKRKAD